MRKGWPVLLVAGLLILLTGCNDPPDPYAYQRATVSYQEYLADQARWDAVKNAGAAFLVALLAGLLLAGGVVLVLHVLREARALALVAPAPNGTLPVPVWTVLTQPAGAYQLAAGVQVVQLAASQASRAVPTHVTKQITYAPPAALPPAEAPAPLQLAPPLPPPFAFSAGVLGQGWRPSPQGIYLATQPDGRWLLLPPHDAMHGLMAGETGGGKSNIFMMWIAQLLAARVHVVYLNPHAMQWDLEHRVDWRPINAALGERLIRDPDAILAYLRWLCEEELPARKERGWRGEPVGPLLYTFVDEWPALLKHDRRAADYYACLVREGRKYGLYLVTAAQDALVKTLGGSSGERQQFQVVYYVGGDKYTKAAILEVPQDAPEPTEVGLAYVKVGKAPAVLARVPLMDNPALYTLLGWPATPPPWGWDAAPPDGAWVRATIVEAGEGAEGTAPEGLPPFLQPDPPPTAAAARPFPPEVDPAKVERVRELMRRRAGQTAIIEAIWGVSGGRAFKAAADELTAIQAWLIEEAA
jgi:hypothetical protein